MIMHRRLASLLVTILLVTGLPPAQAFSGPTGFQLWQGTEDERTWMVPLASRVAADLVLGTPTTDATGAPGRSVKVTVPVTGRPRRVTLFYRSAGGQERYRSVSMRARRGAANLYDGSVPGRSLRTAVAFYIVAQQSSGGPVTYPPGGTAQQPGPGPLPQIEVIPIPAPLQPTLTLADGQVQLSWPAVDTPDLTQYVVYQSANGGRLRRVTAVKSPSYTGRHRKGVQYRVTARNRWGVEGPPSPEAAEASVPAAGTPPAGTPSVGAPGADAPAAGTPALVVSLQEPQVGAWVRGRLHLAASVSGGKPPYAVSFFAEDVQFGISTASPPTAVLDTTGYPDGRLNLRIEARDAAEGHAQAEAVVTVDNTPPVIANVTDRPGERGMAVTAHVVETNPPAGQPGGVVLYHRPVGTETFSSVAMTDSQGTWMADLPKHDGGTEYYVTATDAAGNAASSPPDAPHTVHQIAAAPPGAGGPTVVSGELAGNRTWSGAGGPYMLQGSVRIPAGATLRLTPGTVVKFEPDARLVVEGELEGRGTAQRPVVFTSLRDDAAGGDTNGDGTATAPAPGDWGQIQVAAGATARLENVQIRYAGRDSTGTAEIIRSGGRVRVDHAAIPALAVAGDLELRTSTVAHSFYTAVSIQGERGTLTGNTFAANGRPPRFANYEWAVPWHAAVRLEPPAGVPWQGVVSQNTFTGLSAGAIELVLRNASLSPAADWSGNAADSDRAAITLSGTLGQDLTLAPAPSLNWGFAGLEVPTGVTLTVTAGTRLIGVTAPNPGVPLDQAAGPATQRGSPGNLWVLGHLRMAGSAEQPVRLEPDRDPVAPVYTRTVTPPPEAMYLFLSSTATADLEGLVARNLGIEEITGLPAASGRDGSLRLVNSSLITADGYYMPLRYAGTARVENTTLHNMQLATPRLAMSQSTLSGPFHEFMALLDGDWRIAQSRLESPCAITLIYAADRGAEPKQPVTLDWSRLENNTFGVGSGVCFDNAEVFGDLDLRAGPAFYRVGPLGPGQVIVHGTLRAAPGTTVLFGLDSGLRAANMEVIGTAEHPITFTTFVDPDLPEGAACQGDNCKPQAGMWQGLTISDALWLGAPAAATRPTTGAAHLQHVHIRYGGGQYDPYAGGQDETAVTSGANLTAEMGSSYGCVTCSLRVENSHVERSVGNGLVIKAGTGAAASRLSHVFLERNAGWGLAANGTGGMAQSYIAANGWGLTGGGVAATALWDVSDNYWGDPLGPPPHGYGDRLSGLKSLWDGIVLDKQSPIFRSWLQRPASTPEERRCKHSGGSEQVPPAMSPSPTPGPQAQGTRLVSLIGCEPTA